MAQAASRGKASARDILGSSHIMGRFANRPYALEAFEHVRIWDFGRTAEMIAKGREIGLEYLRKRGQI